MERLAAHHTVIAPDYPPVETIGELKTYEAGHMFYLDVDSLAAFKSDINDFIQTAC